MSLVAVGALLHAKAQVDGSATRPLGLRWCGLRSEPRDPPHPSRVCLSNTDCWHQHNRE
jgi:hypothetical protein